VLQVWRVDVTDIRDHYAGDFFHSSNQVAALGTGADNSNINPVIRFPGFQHSGRGKGYRGSQGGAGVAYEFPSADFIHFELPAEISAKKMSEKGSTNQDQALRS